jgi:hypothetical protein
MALARRLRRFRRHPRPGDIARLSISDPTLTVGGISLATPRVRIHPLRQAHDVYQIISICYGQRPRRGPTTALPSSRTTFLWPDPRPRNGRLKTRVGVHPGPKSTRSYLHANVASEHQPGAKRIAGRKNSLTVHWRSPSIRAGARERWCTMRDEFASKSFLAVTVTGVVLLCSGLVAFALT